jgi:hypothetical protein
MSPTVTAAVLMMIAALPTMFIVIGVFIVLTNLLVRIFPAEDED